MNKRLRGKAMCVTVFSLLFATYNLCAQAPAAPVVNLIIQPHGTTSYNPITDTTSFPFQNDTAQISLVLKLQDTTNVSVIHVSLGTTSGGSDLFQQDFTFDGSPPGGTAYSRNGFAVYLGLGNFYGFTQIYSSVSLGNSMSQTSSIVSSSYP